MADLKNFIDNNRTAFDDDEPLTGHFDRFSQRLGSSLPQPVKEKKRVSLLKVAAAIIILVSAGGLLMDALSVQLRNVFMNQTTGNDLPQELKDALLYYESETASKLETMKQLAVNQNESTVINADVVSEIQKLDASVTELKKSLEQTPGNQRIFDAIIQNQQMKETMLNTIIRKLEKSQNTK